MALQNLLYMAHRKPQLFNALLHKKQVSRTKGGRIVFLCLSAQQGLPWLLEAVKFCHVSPVMTAIHRYSASFAESSVPEAGACESAQKLFTKQQHKAATEVCHQPVGCTLNISTGPEPTLVATGVLSAASPQGVASALASVFPQHAAAVSANPLR